MANRTVQSTKPSPELQYVSPDLLDFDTENPRFAGEVSNRTQEDIQQYLFGKPHYASELVDSFLENGFIVYEPLVVKRKGDRFAVIEGNRRLAAIKEIRGHLDRYPARISDLDSIPVLIFPEASDEVQKNDMRVYLGVRHLLGFREWPPASKAQFLERESQAEGGLDRVIKEVRISKQKVRRFLIPYRLLLAAGIQLPPEEDFWVLGEALSRTGVKKFLGLEVDAKTLSIRSFNRNHFKLLLNDLYGPKKPGSNEREASKRALRDTRDLSRLANVLGSDEASDVLHKGKGLDEAELYVDTREESLKRLGKVTNNLALLLRKVTGSRRDQDSIQLQQSFKQFESMVRAYFKKNA